MINQVNIEANQTEDSGQEPYQLIWKNCLSIIKDNINIQSYNTWFSPIKPVSLEGKVLTIQVPSMFFYEWIEEHYVDLLRKTIKKELGPSGKLEYSVQMVKAGLNNTGAKVNLPVSNHRFDDEIEINLPQGIGNIKNPFVIPGLKKINIDAQLNSKFTFENFIEGDCNRLARSASQTAASKPGATAFNPLFLFGSVGIGKTHLAQAIGNEVRQKHKNKTVLYVDANKFASQFIDAIKNNSINDFIAFYYLIDVLIVDDIHILANKEKTQEIFFNIFNHLHQSGKQIICTSDRPPKDLQGIDERLISRFKWGLTADLKMPDFETRVAILEHKMYQDGLVIPKDVIEYVAHNISGSVRELEGVLNSLIAHSSLIKSTVIDLNLTKEILKSFVKQNTKELSIDQIQKVVCEAFDMNSDLLKSKSRKRELVQARQICMYFVKHFTKTSLANIGKYFGGRDHSTVIHACQQVQDLMETDQKYKLKVQEIEKIINIQFV